MSISLVFSDTVAYNAYRNQVTNIVTLQAGDLLIFGVHWRVDGDRTLGDLTWNGQTSSVLHYAVARNCRSKWFALSANTSGTANVAALFSDYTVDNVSVMVLRSSSGALSVSDISQSFFHENDIEAYTNPSFSLTGVESGDFIVSNINLLGWDVDYTVTSSTELAPAAPLSINDSVQNTLFPTAVGRSYISSSTGQTGNVTVAYTRSVGTGNSMYNNAVFVVREPETGGSAVSVNYGNPVSVGQNSISAVVSNFSGGISSITTGESGLTAMVNSTDGDNVNFSVSGWVDGQPYPLTPGTFSFSFSDGTDSNDIDVTVEAGPEYSQVTFSSPDTSNDRKFSKMMVDAGLTVDGSTLYYKTDTIPDLVINPDSSGDPVANGGTFEAFLREVDTGLMRAWTITINEQGVPTDMYRGLTAKGLAATGFTAKYLTAVGP